MRRSILIISLTIIIILVGLTAVIFILGSGHSTLDIEEMVNGLSQEKELNEYMDTINYELVKGPNEDDDGKTEYTYTLEGTLKNKFEKIPPKEQYEFMMLVIKKSEKYAGKVEYTDGDVYCGSDDINCYIDQIIFKTSKHTYWVDYWNSADNIYMYQDEEIVYDALDENGKYKEPTDEIDEEEADTTNYNLSTANGVDWVNYDEGTKYIMVNDALKNIQSGGHSVEFEIDYFIGALDAYYGDGTDSNLYDLLIEIISLVGVVEGLIKDE